MAYPPNFNYFENNDSDDWNELEFHTQWIRNNFHRVNENSFREAKGEYKAALQHMTEIGNKEEVEKAVALMKDVSTDYHSVFLPTCLSEHLKH
jgi:hypothetical protein